MRLERVKIQNYKCLRNIAVDFSAPAGESDLFSVQFLAGVNGSGKSCFLEALGLIFTRAMQGEVPGFPFELQYRIQREQARVRVKPAAPRANRPGRLVVSVTAGGRTREFDRIPEEYQPRRIVACSSGTNHLMDSVLLSSPRASLASDLFDLSLRGDLESQEEMAQLLEQYRALDANPRIFSFDDQNAKLVAPVLFAVVPGFRGWGDAEGYFDLREKLTERIDRQFVPAAFSLTVDETRLRQFLDERGNSPQYGLLAKLFRREQPELGGPVYSWTVHRPLLPGPGEDGGEPPQTMERMAQTAVFCYEQWPEGGPRGRVWNRRLSEEFDGDPMALLNVLAAAWRSGILRDIQFAFRREGGTAMLGMETLSDGELMWLSRMGLVLMSRLSRSAETLFLLDEPDVHFNNEWNMDFVNTLRQYSQLPGQGLDHEFVITTHSTLLLTDVYGEQIHLFSADQRGVQAVSPSISPFAAQQDELSRQLFSAKPVGSYALGRVQAALEGAASPEDLQELLQKTGPGYQRFRLYEQYFRLKKQRER